MSDSDESGVTHTEPGGPHTWRRFQAQPSPDYVAGPEEPEQAPLSPDYVLGPEHADDEIVAEDQPGQDRRMDDDEDLRRIYRDIPADGGDDEDDEMDIKEDEDDDMDIDANEGNRMMR
ncbi:hypothetical protein Tco_1110158 [Tanacetum coccineum]|uniref:Uncharacterized protein n=1 Tax=Tanacetum coccineum TaxID=301880 RepID=A0ABQ5II29_9ASTR